MNVNASILNSQKGVEGSRNRKKWFKETARDFLCGRLEGRETPFALALIQGGLKG